MIKLTIGDDGALKIEMVRKGIKAKETNIWRIRVNSTSEIASNGPIIIENDEVTIP